MDYNPALWDAKKSDFTLKEILDQVRRGRNAFIDSETVGLNSMMVFWQFAIDDGPIYLHNVWKKPVWFTKRLFEMLMELNMVGFNLSFDHFHLAKVYTIWSLLPDDWIPEDHIEEIAVKYEKAGMDGPCIKPKAACDLLLHSRKGEFQTLMARADIRIRRVPTVLAYAAAKELERRIEIDGIYFAKSKDPEAPRWLVYDRKDKEGIIDPEFKDVCLKFKPAGGLKYLAEYVLKLKPRFHFDDVELPRDQGPPDKKLGFVPFALGMAPGGPEDEWRIYDKNKKPRGHAWPYWIKRHIDHWAENANAREYAFYDIVYTRGLYKYFNEPEPGDDDSELACMVGVVRWHGFEIDKPGMRKLLQKAQERVDASPVNINSVKEVREYIEGGLNWTEGLALSVSTRKANLIAISKMCIGQDEHGTTCNKCDGDGCQRCVGQGVMDANKEIIYDNTGGIKVGNLPAAALAAELLEVKAAFKEIEIYQKLLQAGRFHPDFNVIGTLSTRMSGGSGGLNAQGIKHTKEVRKLFPLKWAGSVLSGGDFDSFEVVLAATVYNDKDLTDALTNKIACNECPHGETCKQCKGSGITSTGHKCKFCIEDEDKNATGKYRCPACGGKGWFRKKIHALFGMAMYPGRSYEDIMASDGTSFDMYTRGKSGVFGMIYGGDWNTLVKNFGLEEDVAKEAEARFFRMFPGIKRSRQRVENMFQSMKQIDGGNVVWRDPDEHIESFLGFRRYFTLENRICKALYQMARKPPKEWRDARFKDIKVVRSIKKGVQGASGAVLSALYGSAFAIQNANVRAAANHEVQSPGGQICKRVQRLIWDLQPSGVHPLYVAPLNVHDEIMTVNHPDYVDRVAEAVVEGVESFRDRVPLIGMTWNKQQENWAEKKSGSDTVKIQAPEMAA
jgi:hypothetical protein